MASLADMQDALVKADAAGDVESARALTQHIDWLTDPKGGNYQAPAAPAATDAPAPVNALSPRFGTTLPGRLIQGAIVDPVIGGAQAIVNTVPAIADWLGVHEYAATVRGKAGEMNRGITDYMREYEGDRSPGAGFDAARFVGSMASPANNVVPFAGATTLPRVVGLGMAQGAVSGALAPVDDGGGDYGSAKGLQIGAGAVVGGAVGALADRIAAGATNLIGRFRGTPAAPDVDNVIRQAAKANGVDVDTLPTDTVNQVRNTVTAALDRGRVVDPAGALRMAEGDAVLGPEAGLTVGQATRDPQQWRREYNFRSVQGAGNALAVRTSAQNKALIAATNDAGAATASGDMVSGKQLLDGLKAHDDRMQSTVGDLYSKAMSMNGGDIPLDAQSFSKQTSTALHENMAELFLPREFRTILDKIQSGDMPLTVSTAEQLKTRLGMADAAAGDGNTRYALGVMRRELDAAPPTNPSKLADGVMTALDTARAAHKSRMDAIEANPAMGAMLRDTAPDDFFQKYVVNGKARDLAQLRSVLDPQTVAATHDQIVGYLKSKALNKASDEVGSFSQSSFNKALTDIGDDKLASFFSADEIARLHQIGRVASYIDVAPGKGAQPNRSGTAAAALDMITSVAPIINLNAPKAAIKKYKEDAFVRDATGPLPTTPGPDKPMNALARGFVRSTAGGTAADVADEVPSATRRRRN